MEATMNPASTASEWMPLNLPWMKDFWQRMDAMTLMRLNPHWHIDVQEDRFAVDDILANKEFTIAPRLESTEDSWSASFDDIGLTIHARSAKDGANTELAYVLAGEPGAALDSDALEKGLRYWLPSTREYYRLYENNSMKHRFWRMVMNKIMLKMNPTQRRICGFMFKLTLLEIALIIVLGVGFFFYNGG